MKILVLNDGKTCSLTDGCMMVNCPDYMLDHDIEKALEDIRHNKNTPGIRICCTFGEDGGFTPGDPRDPNRFTG